MNLQDIMNQITNLGSQIRVLGSAASSQHVGGTADGLIVSGALSVHDREQADGRLEAGVGHFAGVPGAVLIERGLAGQEVGLGLVVAEGGAGGIKVTLVDHLLQDVDGLGDVGIVPSSFTGKDLVAARNRRETIYTEILNA